jgi:hypothetical protein
MNLCKYKDIGGKPGEGVHKYRLFNLALADLIPTIIIGVLIAKYFKWNVWKTLLVVFVIGIIAHRLFCVRTTIDKFLFPNVKE